MENFATALAYNELVKIAHELVQHAQTCWLQLYVRSIAKGDGSCFFHAVVDQVESLSDRAGLYQNILCTADPAASLREKVINFMENSTHSRVKQMKSKGIYFCIIGFNCSHSMF